MLGEELYENHTEYFTEHDFILEKLEEDLYSIRNLANEEIARIRDSKERSWLTVCQGLDREINSHIKRLPLLVKCNTAIRYVAESTRW